jgi:uncharacterized membrane protein YdjX (TVP38/TMEM64 family)
MGANGEPDPSAAKPSWRKPAIFIGGVLVLLAVMSLSPLRQYLSRWSEVSNQIQRMGWWAPAGYTCGVAVLVAVGLPRLLFCVIGGMAFGFWQGLLWTQSATLAGNYVTFLFARWGGRDFVARYFSRWRTPGDLVRREGWVAVILARQVPMPGLIVNLAFGLSSIRHRHFLLGTALGQIPEAIPCTLIGSGAIQSSWGKGAGILVLAVLILTLVWLGWRVLADCGKAKASSVGVDKPEKPV